jgi:hypothetical protein
MAGLVAKSLSDPDEIRPFKDGMGQLELVDLEAGGVGRATFQPGWQWSKHVKPIAGTDSCMAAHVGYVICGRMTIRMDDGQEFTSVRGTTCVAHRGTTPGSSATTRAWSSTGKGTPTTRRAERAARRRLSATALSRSPRNLFTTEVACPE